MFTISDFTYHPFLWFVLFLYFFNSIDDFTNVSWLFFVQVNSPSTLDVTLPLQTGPS
jgi:hypothetical protein